MTYVLAQLTIHDRARYERYAARFMDVLRRFEGRLLASDESPEVLEGKWPHQKVVLIEFKDREEASRWASSPEYREIAVDREGSTVATILAVRGLGGRARRDGVPVAIVGVDHVQLAMPSGREDEAREFYSRLLGLPERAKPELAQRGGAWFENDAVKIHLGVDAEFHPARKAHPVLLVRGLRPLVARLREAGIEVADAGAAGHDRVYVCDPFGNRLELIESRASTDEPGRR